MRKLSWQDPTWWRERLGYQPRKSDPLPQKEAGLPPQKNTKKQVTD